MKVRKLKKPKERIGSQYLRIDVEIESLKGNTKNDFHFSIHILSDSYWRGSASIARFIPHLLTAITYRLVTAFTYRLSDASSIPANAYF